MVEHAIVIRHAPSGVSFAVTVEPPAPWARYDQERPDHRAAKRYAESIRVVTCFPIRNETGGRA